MKRFFAVISISFAALAVLSGCALYGNDRSIVGGLSVDVKEDSIDLYLANGPSLTFDGDALTSGENERTVPMPVVRGDTFPRNEVRYAEGYEGLEEKIQTLAEEKGRDLYTVYAYRTGETVYGFVDFYRSAVGFLSGGGQISTEKFSSAVLFSYEKETGAFEKTEFDRLTIAYDGTYAVYFEENYYYSVAVGTEDEPVGICEDVAIDTGLSHYSSANFCYGDGYIVLYFRNENGSYQFRKNYELYVLARMNGEKLGEIKIT